MSAWCLQLRKWIAKGLHEKMSRVSRNMFHFRVSVHDETWQTFYSVGIRNPFLRAPEDLVGIYWTYTRVFFATCSFLSKSTTNLRNPIPHIQQTRNKRDLWVYRFLSLSRLPKLGSGFTHVWNVHPLEEDWHTDWYFFSTESPPPPAFSTSPIRFPCMKGYASSVWGQWA